MYVQGSTRLPEEIDSYATEIVTTKIKEKIDNLDTKNFMLYKRKNIDAITSNKFNLNNILEITEGELLRNPNPSNESFDIYENIEKYSAGLTKEDLVKFFNKVFINKDNLRLTSYVRI